MGIVINFRNLKKLILDVDDTLYTSSPLIQFYIERTFPQFAKSKLLIKERTINALIQLQKLTDAEIEKARKENRAPILPNLNAQNNDIIRDSVKSSTNYEYDTYIRPSSELDECINDATYAKEMFMESRDAALEADGKLPISEGKIPYHKIYVPGNRKPYVQQNLRELYNNFGGDLSTLTAHNGIDDEHGREFEAKKDDIQLMVPNMRNDGLRFHATEHIEDGIRRPRNSKGLRIMHLYGLDNLNGVVNIDDSVDNCKDILEYGGSPIWLCEDKNAANPNGFARVRSIQFESIERELRRLGFDREDGYVYGKPGDESTLVKVR